MPMIDLDAEMILKTIRKQADTIFAAYYRTAGRRIVTLCGSTRFSAAFRDANLRETLKGKIVLSIGCDMRSDTEIFGNMSPTELTDTKAKLDILHLDKITMSDEILVLNVGGYVGESTTREIKHALSLGRPIRWLEPDNVPTWFAGEAQP